MVKHDEEEQAGEEEAGATASVAWLANMAALEKVNLRSKYWAPSGLLQHLAALPALRSLSLDLNFLPLVGSDLQPLLERERQSSLPRLQLLRLPSSFTCPEQLPPGLRVAFLKGLRTRASRVWDWW